MRINGKYYTRADVLQRVGNLNQLGGTRRCVLNDGRSKGVEAIDFDTGSGFRFTVLPDRAMDISSASYKGTNLVYLTANGEVHPAYFESRGLGWLRSFFAGLLTTCGLTYLGPPVKDGDEGLGAHGRATTTPARQVRDNSGWYGDEYKLEVTGVIEESVLFGDKIRLTRTISSSIGSKSVVIKDVAENFGYRSSPFTILYHVNPGFPLLDESSELMLSVKDSEPCDGQSSSGINKMFEFSKPVKDFPEENFLHYMESDQEGCSYAGFINRQLDGGLGIFIKFSSSTLPYLNEWKMMGQGDYVVGIEPCNVPCEDRVTLRGKGLLPILEPGETREMIVEIGVLNGEADIDNFVGLIHSVTGGYV